MEFQINYLAVIVAAVADMVVGGLWYSVLFAKMWMKAAGKTKKDMEGKGKEAMQSMGLSTLAALVTAYVMAHMLQYIGAIDVRSAWFAAFWLWLGFLAAGVLPAYAYEGQHRKWSLYFIFIGYKLVAFFAMALILTYWV